MATYVLIPGAGSDSWYWHRVVPLLRARGHDVVTPDLPCADETAGLAEYTEVVLEAIGNRKDLVLVAQSMGGFTAPLVCARVPVELMVLVAAMVPAPGESPGDWWANTGQPGARRELDVREGRDPDAEFDPRITFLHDVPEDVAAALMVRPVLDQAEAPFLKPWPLSTWPQVPTKFLLCRQDRFFPADFQRRVVQERLGFTPDEMDGGHLPALAHPQELVEHLEAYRICNHAESSR
ncbi:alpha/beta hydrolase [Streptomyces sp. SID13666]|uniref:alpha/beta hydrolase n=1 Tax=unclassified Streptomyces TaxID=2593676 RepID=UPI0013BFE8EA|nr:MULTISPECIES: alpha/beta hydrolase [unclassified Streptomyces]NEA56161.1 alpha/beta hydrolase [Streptomyces sp. SID13666]NEA71832.1 alpha/beta hydrolase [Streptomyces sp. SID13588]